jgi:hypothetical protein
VGGDDHGEAYTVIVWSVGLAGGLWEPGSRRWLIERKRMGPLIRNLRRDTDPLFRQAGLDLDRE